MRNSGSVQLMPVNVGWSDIQGTVQRKDYGPRSCYLKIIQVDENDEPLEGGASRIFQVFQHEGIDYEVYENGETIDGYGTAKAFLGSSPYYQFGRKDPFLGRDYTEGDPINIKFSSYSGYSILNSSNSTYTVNYANLGDTYSSNVDFSLAIQNPHIYYRSGSSTWDIWYKGGVISSIVGSKGTTYTPDQLVVGFEKQHGFHNLWHAFSDGHGAGSSGDVLSNDKRIADFADTKVRKTVYDPCPPDFCIPRRNAFSAFTSDGGPHAPSSSASSNYVNGWWDKRRGGFHFYKKRMQGDHGTDPSGGSVFFCRTGIRRNGSLRGGGFQGWGAYWTADRADHYAIHLVFSEAASSPTVYPFYRTNGTFADSWSVRAALEEQW